MFRDRFKQLLLSHIVSPIPESHLPSKADICSSKSELDMDFVRLKLFANFGARHAARLR